MSSTTRQIINSQKILKYTYGLVPIVAGADKFTNLLTDWKQYASASLAGILPITAGSFLLVAGVVEILAGILVLTRPRIGAYVVMAWLIAIAFTLIAGGHYLDVAVRDLVMAAGALVLAKLSRLHILPE